MPISAMMKRGSSSETSLPSIVRIRALPLRAIHHNPKLIIEERRDPQRRVEQALYHVVWITGSGRFWERLFIANRYWKLQIHGCLRHQPATEVAVGKCTDELARHHHHEHDIEPVQLGRSCVRLDADVALLRVTYGSIFCITIIDRVLNIP